VVKILVGYYSRSGNTKGIAEVVAEHGPIATLVVIRRGGLGDIRERQELYD